MGRHTKCANIILAERRSHRITRVTKQTKKTKCKTQTFCILWPVFECFRFFFFVVSCGWFHVLVRLWLQPENMVLFAVCWAHGVVVVKWALMVLWFVSILWRARCTHFSETNMRRDSLWRVLLGVFDAVQCTQLEVIFWCKWIVFGG